MAQTKKKKRFFEVNIPLIDKGTQLQAYEYEELDKRIIKYDLTRVLRGKNMVYTGIISIVDGNAIVTSKKIQLLPYFLKRLVRKGTRYVEDSFSTDCVNAQIRIKPFLVTRRKVSRAVRRSLRDLCKTELIKYVKNKQTEQVFDDVLKNKIQKILSLKLKKIYPLSTCEIRILDVERFKDPSEIVEVPAQIVEQNDEEAETTTEEIETVEEQTE